MKNKIIKWFPALIAVVAAGVIFCCSCADTNNKVAITEEDAADGIVVLAESEKETDTSYETGTQTGVWVYVCGEVKDPGVYYLEESSRIMDAIEMAGGMTEDADRVHLNLASPIEDGQQIYVPNVSENSEKQLETYTDGGSGLIDLNTASLEELKTLPGIGDSKASAIIEYRKNTPFETIEDIMNVSGIKENSFQKIKDMIKV